MSSTGHVRVCGPQSRISAGDLHAITAANNLLAAALDARMFHEATQKDGALFNRLCPAKGGQRTFAPIMRTRLHKLGIQAQDPDELSPEDQGRCRGCLTARSCVPCLHAQSYLLASRQHSSVLQVWPGTGLPVSQVHQLGCDWSAIHPEHGFPFQAHQLASPALM